MLFFMGDKLCEQKCRRLIESIKTNIDGLSSIELIKLLPGNIACSHSDDHFLYRDVSGEIHTCDYSCMENYNIFEIAINACTNTMHFTKLHARLIAIQLELLY